MARILVVNPEPDIGRLLHDALGRAGHDVTLAASGAAMGQALSDHDYDLVVLDLVLPDGDGIALCHQIHEVYDLPVFITSSLENEVGMVAIGTALGPQAYLTKPFALNDFVTRVEDHLNHPPQSGCGPAGAPTSPG